MIVVKLIKSLFVYLLYTISLLFPRDKKIWVYGSFANSFLDNSKYLFLHHNKNYRNARHIWLSGSRETVRLLTDYGFESFYKYSVKGIYLALRARVYIYSAYPGDISHMSLCGGSLRFNLWHGLPLKKIEYDIKVGPLQKIYNPKNLYEKISGFISGPQSLKRSTAVLTTNIHLKSIFSSAFKVAENNVVIGQYPRIMPFFWSKEELNDHITKLEPLEMNQLLQIMKSFKEVWIYMPTWRDSNPGFMNEAIPDILRLNEVCKNKNILFIIKLHVNTSFRGTDDLSNIVILKNTMDIYPLLPSTHTLVTDYSSIFFDYSLLKRKTIFYPFDLKDYLSGSREFYFDYNSITTDELLAETFDQLIDYINNDSYSNDTRFDKYKNFVNSSSDCSEITSFIEKTLNKTDISN